MMLRFEKREEEYKKIQPELAAGIDLSDKISPREIKLISGVDLAYWKEDETDYAVCCIVTIDYTMPAAPAHPISRY